MLDWLALALLPALGRGFSVVGRRLSDPDRRKRRELRSRSVVAIADVHEGQLAKITGRVVPGEEMLLSPLSNRHCVYWSVVAHGRGEEGRVGWYTLLDESAGQPFLLDDGTARALVDPTHAWVSLKGHARLDSNRLERTPVTLAALVQRVPRVKQGSWLQPSYPYPVRLLEQCLVPGDDVSVSGLATRELDSTAAASYREAATKVVMRRGGSTDLLIGN